jgi:hypothetical protein
MVDGGWSFDVCPSQEEEEEEEGKEGKGESSRLSYLLPSTFSKLMH